MSYILSYGNYMKNGSYCVFVVSDNVFNRVHVSACVYLYVVQPCIATTVRAGARKCGAQLENC